MNKGNLLLITLLISHKTVINAAPMSFKDSITSMSTISKSYSYLESSYALSPKDAFGINISENKGDTYKLEAGEFFYLRRLMRINKINVNKFLKRIDKNLIGIGMPFINQNLPGPISNEIILDMLKKLK